jgi:hypothetical protein
MFFGKFTREHIVRHVLQCAQQSLTGVEDFGQKIKQNGAEQLFLQHSDSCAKKNGVDFSTPYCYLPNT